MTEPTNPLFEDEKDFLLRKKLEYERALRGDVQEIKEQTVQVGKVALIGAGAISGVWLLVKAFGGSKPKNKRKHKNHQESFKDYPGFDGLDEQEHDWNESATDLRNTDYAYDQDGNYVPAGSDDGFYYAGASDEEDDLDDNGLSKEPNFPAHSSTTHGFATYADEAPYEEEGGFAKEFGGKVTDWSASLPYDDSRRLMPSNQFGDNNEELDNEEDKAEKNTKSGSILGLVGPALLSFAKSEVGRVVAAQAAAVALAMATKVVQDIMPKDQDADKTGKNADLADSSATKGVQPVAWPATSAAQDATAAAHHDDTLATTSKPLA